MVEGPAVSDSGADPRSEAARLEDGRGMAVFDLDRTITRCPTFVPFFWFVAKRRPRRLIHLGPILLAAAAYGLGFISRKRLKEFFLRGILRGAARPEVEAWAESFVARRMASWVRPGARRAIERHKASGDYLVLASASFDLYVERFGAQFGFDSVVATKAEWDGAERISGRIDGENCYGAEKLRRLEDVLQGVRGCRVVLAYSDSHVDLPMLRWADRAVAVNPTRRLRRIAEQEAFELVDWGSVA